MHDEHSRDHRALEHDLSSAFAALIARHPDDAAQLSDRHWRELVGVSKAVFADLREAVAALRRIVELADRRSASDDDDRLCDLLTEAERAEFAGAQRRVLCAERAEAALAAWAERTGAERCGFAIAARAMTTSEEPDGKLVIHPEAWEGPC